MGEKGEKRGPLDKWSLGGVSLAAFNFDGRLSFTMKKSYKTESGEWKDTNWFSLQDLCMLQAVINNAVGFGLSVPRETLKAAAKGKDNDDDVPY